MASEGQKIYARDCAACHEPRAEFTNKVIPITDIKTDPERMYSWSKDAAAEANRRVKKLGIDRPPNGGDPESLRIHLAAARRNLAARALSSQLLYPDAARLAESAQ